MFSLIKLTFAPQTREIVSRGLKTRNDGVFGEEGGLINSSFLEAVIRKSRRPFRGAWKLARYINVTRRRSFYDSVFSHRPVTHRRVFSFHRPSIEEREARISSSWTRDNRPLSFSLSLFLCAKRSQEAPVTFIAKFIRFESSDVLIDERRVEKQAWFFPPVIGKY